MKVIEKYAKNRKGEKLCAHFFLPQNNEETKTKFPLVIMLTGMGLVAPRV